MASLPSRHIQPSTFSAVAWKQWPSGSIPSILGRALEESPDWLKAVLQKNTEQILKGKIPYTEIVAASGYKLQHPRVICFQEISAPSLLSCSIMDAIQSRNDGESALRKSIVEWKLGKLETHLHPRRPPISLKSKAETEAKIQILRNPSMVPKETLALWAAEKAEKERKEKEEKEEKKQKALIEKELYQQHLQKELNSILHPSH